MNYKGFSIDNDFANSIANSLPGMPNVRENHSFNQSNDERIVYKLNNSYRSEVFSPGMAKNNYLFNGCSVTFGLGLPVDHTWPAILNEMLDGKNTINLGLPGKSFHTIIYETFRFIELFGKPKAIFLLMPNLERYHFPSIEKTGRTKLPKNHKDYMPLHKVNINHISLIEYHSNHHSKSLVPTKKDFKFTKKILNQELVVFEFISLIKILEQYCNAANIDLFWSTWEINLAKEIDNLNPQVFNNYLSMFSEESLYLRYRLGDEPPEGLGENGKYWLEAADIPNAHPGIREQTVFANIFLDSYLKKQAS